MIVWILGGVAAFGVGIWIGMGTPGIKHEPRYHRHHDSSRSLNPIAMGRLTGRERQRPRSIGSRRDERRSR